MNSLVVAGDREGKEAGPVPVASSRRAATALAVLIKSTAEQKASKHNKLSRISRIILTGRIRTHNVTVRERAKQTPAVYREFQTKIGTALQSIKSRTKHPTKLSRSREKLSLSGFPLYIYRVQLATVRAILDPEVSLFT